MLSAVAITLSLEFLLPALFLKAQPEEIPDEPQREQSHPVNKRVGQQN